MSFYAAVQFSDLPLRRYDMIKNDTSTGRYKRFSHSHAAFKILTCAFQSNVGLARPPSSSGTPVILVYFIINDKLIGS